MPVVESRLLAAVPSAVLAVVVALALAFAVEVWVAIGVGLACGLAMAIWIHRRAPAMALRSLGADALPEGDEPRLESVVESICATAGVAEPALHVVESRAPDLALVGRAGATHLVVTTGALRQLDRLELEAVVARQLASSSAGVEAATVLVPVGRLLGPLAPRLRALVLDDRRLAAADIDGVRVTRYPPALASALEKAAATEGVPDRAATRHLWMIGPAGTTDASHPPLDERIDTLREL